VQSITASGMDGRLAAIGVVSGVISSGDRSSLRTWATSTWGTP
jgi:hypothetical protein